MPNATALETFEAQATGTHAYINVSQGAAGLAIGTDQLLRVLQSFGC